VPRSTILTSFSVAVAYNKQNSLAWALPLDIFLVDASCDEALEGWKCCKNQDSCLGFNTSAAASIGTEVFVRVVFPLLQTSTVRVTRWTRLLLSRNIHEDTP